MNDVFVGVREGRITMGNVLPGADVIIWASIGAVGSLVAVVAEEGRGVIALTALLTTLASALGVLGSVWNAAKKHTADHHAATMKIDADHKVATAKIEAEHRLALARIEADVQLATLRLHADANEAAEAAKLERHDLAGKLQVALVKIEIQDAQLQENARMIHALVHHRPADPAIAPPDAPPPGPDYST